VAHFDNKMKTFLLATSAQNDSSFSFCIRKYFSRK